MWTCNGFGLGHGLTGWGLLFGGLQFVALVLLIWFGYRMYKKATVKNAADDAVRILKTRYAQGELDDEEYRRRLEELTKE